jgi:hypothetical protein
LYRVMMTNPSPDSALDLELQLLHDDYVRQINAAVQAGRDDLAASLSQDFPEDALDLLVRAGAGEVRTPGRS